MHSLKSDTFGKRKTYEAGDYLCLQGEEPTTIFVLVEGAVNVIVIKDLEGVATRERTESEGTVIATLDEPDTLIGEVGVFLGHRTSSLRATCRVDVLAIPFALENINESVLANPDLGLTLSRTIARRLYQNDLRLEHTAHSLGALENAATLASLDFYLLVDAVASRTDLPVGGDTPLAKGIAEARVSAAYRQGVDVAVRHVSAREHLTSIVSLVGESRTLKPDETLLREGEPPGACFIVTSGRLGVTVGGLRVGTIIRGETVGEMACLLPDLEHRTATVKALESTEVVTIPREHFEDAIRKQPYTILYINRSLTRRLDHTNAVLIDAERAFLEALEAIFGGPESVGADIEAFKDALIATGEDQPELASLIEQQIASAEDWLSNLEELFAASFPS